MTPLVTDDTCYCTCLLCYDTPRHPAIPQVNILYVAVTRARRRLVVNTSLRAFLANTGAWNSVCLRGVAGCRLGEVAAAADTASSPLAESASARCALCGGRADVGGGGDRLAGLSRAQATAASEEVGVGDTAVDCLKLIYFQVKYVFAGSFFRGCCCAFHKGWCDGFRGCLEAVECLPLLLQKQWGYLRTVCGFVANCPAASSPKSKPHRIDRLRTVCHEHFCTMSNLTPRS